MKVIRIRIRGYKVIRLKSYLKNGVKHYSALVKAV